MLSRPLGVAALLLVSACATQPPPAPPARLADMTDYILVRTDGGARTPTPVSVAEAADALKNYDVVFIGELHRHPGNHLAEMALFRALHERDARISLSLEQFERDVQSTLDDYLAGKIGEESLKSEGRAWDNYPVSYRPLVEYAKAHQLPVIAAEAPTMVVRCVGQEGPEFLARMKPDQRGWAAAQLHLQEGPYKDKFLKFAGGDGGHGEGPSDDARKAATLRSFAAQVTRDDTMAESIYLHRQKNPGRKVVHLNGTFHSESFLGTAERLKLRDPSLKIAVVSPVEVGDPNKLAVSDEDAKRGTFVLQILPQPEAYASMDEARAAIKKQMSFRQNNKCEL